MRTNPVLSISVVILVLLAAACSSRRNASERACARAEKHRAKAIWLCPQMLGMDSAAIRFVIPGDTAVTTARWTDPEVDSLLAACEQFAAALAIERSLFQFALEQRDSAAAVRATPPPRYNGAATEAIRRLACAFEPITATTGLCIATVRPGPNGPLLTVEQLPVDTTGKAPCPPQVNPAPCPECTGVASWYRTAFWGIVSVLALGLCIVVLMIARSFRQWPPGYTVVLVLLMASTSMSAQKKSGWHDLPPPMNIVNGGFLLEHAATTGRDATYVALAGVAVGAVMYTQNSAVGGAIGGLSLGYALRLQLRSKKSMRKAAQLFQIGYRAENLYDVVPDSIDAHPHLRIIPK